MCCYLVHVHGSIVCITCCVGHCEFIYAYGTSDMVSIREHAALFPHCFIRPYGIIHYMLHHTIAYHDAKSSLVLYHTIWYSYLQYSTTKPFPTFAEGGLPAWGVPSSLLDFKQMLGVLEQNDRDPLNKHRDSLTKR